MSENAPATPAPTPQPYTGRARTALVGLLCFAGASTGAYLLYRDINQGGARGLGAPMAKLERRENKVRRKPSNSFAWSNAQLDEQLYRRDSVQTGAAAGAAVRFNDGTMIELGENSLIVIDDLQKLSLDFLKGAVVVHSAQGDRRVTVGKDGKARFEELPIRLVKPEPLARFFAPAREARKIHFAWEARPGQDAALEAGFSVQVSPDRGFRGPRTRLYPYRGARTLEADQPLAEGTYFWRLVSAAGDQALTDVSQFRVIAANALVPVAPAGGEKLTVFGEETSTQFRWRPPEDSDGGATQSAEHQLFVARDAQFKSVVARETVNATGGVATLRNLPAAPLYWRLISRYGELAVSSGSERFELDRAQRPTISLTLPEDRKTLERTPTLRLSWASDSQGLTYVLEIQGSQGASVLSTRVTTKGFVWKDPPAGAYRWRVTAVHGTENAAETGWRTFSVFEGKPLALTAPARAAEIYYWEKPVGFDLSWSPDSLLESRSGYAYQVVYAHDAEFKDAKLGPKVRDTSVASSKLGISAGAAAPSDYYWKVQLVDESGQTIKASEPWRFAYGPHPALQAPRALGPVPQTVFNLGTSPENPVASWAPVKDAEGYELTLLAPAPSVPGRAPANVEPRVVYQTTTDKTTVELKDLKPAGYTWTVRAIDRNRRKGQPMPAVPFTVTYGDLLSPPKILTPEVQ